MTQTAVAPIPATDQSAHLTTSQRRQLLTLIADRLQVHQNRAARAEEVLDAFTGSDSPDEREAARDAHLVLLDGIREYEDALARLDAGTYGLCSVCARPIPFERLEAIPEVSHCVQCVRPG